MCSKIIEPSSQDGKVEPEGQDKMYKHKTSA